MFEKTIHLAARRGPAPRVIRGESDLAKALRTLRRFLCRKLVGPVFWGTFALTVTLAVAGTAGILGGAYQAAGLALTGTVAVAAGGSRMTRWLARLSA